MSQSVLTGEKVLLRRLERDDLPRTWGWMHRPEIYERIGVTVPFSPTQQDAWFAKLEQATDKMVFAVCRLEDREHIGNVSLDMLDWRHRNARLSVFIALDGERGRGFGSDALRTLTTYAFSYLGLHKLWCKADAGDPRLRQFYERLGFVQEGLLREHEFKNGAFVDKAIFAILTTGAAARP